MLLKLLRTSSSEVESTRLAILRSLDRRLVRQMRMLRNGPGSASELSYALRELRRLSVIKRQLAGMNASTMEELETVVSLSDKRSTLARSEGLTLNADLLYALHHRLFPAERMAVIAADQTGTLGGVFDVTNEMDSHVGYTKADPLKLGAALVAIDKAGSRLAAWAHSHPGRGPHASYPSQIDARQQSAWLLNYPSLVGLIVTIDGYVRLWGTDEQLELRVTGSGTERIEHDLYRLDL